MPINDGIHDPPRHQYHLYLDLHLELLRLIAAHPTWTQRQLANALGVSLGKTNYCVRALKEKGLVKWGNFTQDPNKLSYQHLLTPKGVAHKLRLTTQFLQRKEAEYDQLRAEIAALRQESHLSDNGSEYTLILTIVRSRRPKPMRCMIRGPHLEPWSQWRDGSAFYR